MSNEIPVHMVDTYRTGLKMMSQQTRSKLIDRVYVTNETGKRISEDFIGAVKARKKTERHADTKYANTPHKRRWLTSAPYSIADLLDWDDVMRILNNPGGMYGQAFVAALNRERDTEILAAAIGTTFTGETGTTAEALPDSQKIPAGGTGFTFAKIEEAMDILAGGNAVDTNDMMTVAWTRVQEKEFLQNAEVKSIDYNNQKVLVEGGMGGGKFYGFTYVRLEDWTDEDGTEWNIVPKTGSTRNCVAWTKNSLWYNSMMDIDVRVDPMPGKDHATQIWSGADFGAARSQTSGIVQIGCAE